MASVRTSMFDGKPREAAGEAAGHGAPMIRNVMNRGDWATLIALAVIWGGAFFFIAVAVNEVAPLTYVWLRLSIAAAAMWLFLWWRREPVGLPASVWRPILVLTLLNNVVPFILFGWGQTQIASGLASILNATTPIWGVVVAHLYTRDEPMTGRKLVGVLIGFAGVAVMIGPAVLTSLGGGTLAMLACVTASLCYALAGVWARRFKVMGLPPVAVTTGQLTAGAIVMLPIALLVDQPWARAMPSLGAIAAIVALSLVCTSFAYILYFRLIDRAGATNALLVTLLVPPIAILLGALFLNEVIGPRDIAGLVLIAIGLAAIDGRLFRMFSPAALRRAA
jgi:drug/metabolite transporter (DMT)-like permease